MRGSGTTVHIDLNMVCISAHSSLGILYYIGTVMLDWGSQKFNDGRFKVNLVLHRIIDPTWYAPYHAVLIRQLYSIVILVKTLRGCGFGKPTHPGVYRGLPGTDYMSTHGLCVLSVVVGVICTSNKGEYKGWFSGPVGRIISRLHNICHLRNSWL